MFWVKRKSKRNKNEIELNTFSFSRFISWFYYFISLFHTSSHLSTLIFMTFSNFVIYNRSICQCESFASYAFTVICNAGILSTFAQLHIIQFVICQWQTSDIPLAIMYRCSSIMIVLTVMQLLSTGQGGRVVKAPDLSSGPHLWSWVQVPPLTYLF